MKLEEGELPKGWEVKKLGEVGKCVTGNTPPKNDLYNYGEYIPFVKPPQLQDNKISDAPEKLSKKGAELARILPINSVLITCIGNLGRTALSKAQVATNQQINAIIPKKEIIEGDFLFYQAQSSVFKNQLEDFSSATTVAIVNKSKFETIEIVVPPLPEQQQIVAKIEELFSELENGKKELLIAQAKLKTYRQSLLKWAFEGRLTNKNLKANELPKGWEVKKLGEVCEVKNGKNQKQVVNPKGKYPIYGSAGVIGFADNYLCEGGTTVVGRKGTINKPLYVKDRFWNVDTAFGFCPNSALINSKFLYFFCLGFNFSKLDKSTTIPSLAKTDLQKIDVILPPIPEQQKIVAILESKLTICDAIEEAIKTSIKQGEALRQSILKKAFEGQLIAPKIQKSLESNYKNKESKK
jgi:type I restriction enzyme S subunit